MLFSELTAKPHEINTVIDIYINTHWEEILQDLQTLISIPSFRENDKAQPLDNAPFGPGPRKALDAILNIAKRMGLTTADLAGYLGYADYYNTANAATTKRQIGVIGHVDVVPAGPGWNTDPYTLTRKDGFLLGRGVIDDKGPLLVALHALNIWKQYGVDLPYNVRFLFGAAEETGMEDVVRYRQQFKDPDFLFTPDAEFPVCYGEKGHWDATLISQPFTNGNLIDIRGGTASNAVPGEAFAIVRYDGSRATISHTTDRSNTYHDCRKGLPQAGRITITDLHNGTIRIDACGKCQHASTPQKGINAIGVLIDYLLATHLCTNEENLFLQLEQQLLSTTDGRAFGCACSDEDFGALTMVGGMISYENGRVQQTIDCRFPACISAQEIEQNINKAAHSCGAILKRDACMEPFLVDPQSHEIQALLRAYNDATGENAVPFTMGGGTYARMFSNAASFGPEKPWVPVPNWVGSMHGPNEGISEKNLQEALRIYARVLVSF